MSWLDRIKAPQDRATYVDAPPSKIRKRIAMIPTHELATLVETTVSQVGRHVYDSQHSEDETQAIGHLVEAETGAEALTEMVRELRARRATL